MAVNREKSSRKKSSRKKSSRKRRLAVIKLAILLVAATVAVVLLLVIFNSGDVKMKDGNYACRVGFEGLRVKRIIQALDLGETTGMGGAYYSEDVAENVASFQENNGLLPTGEVDLETWKKLGYSKEEWDLCGIYHSPKKAGKGASKEKRIEAMIERAYDYLGDPYVIGASGPTGPDYGLDCSGLVIQALYAAGVEMDDINPVTHAHPGHEYESRNIWLSDHFEKVDFEERERGDLIFYCNDIGTVIHIAIYLGNDEVIESWPDDVQVSPVIDERRPNIKGVKRVF